MFEVFDHTADLGLRVRAASLEALLADAARGLVAIIVADVATVRPVRQVTLRVAGTEPDYLLFDWLSEVLYRFESERLLLAEFDVRLDAAGLSAECRGETCDPARHLLEHEVKAITYHGLRVARQSDGSWLAEVIVDI